MNPLDFIEDYLYDNQEGLRNLLVWFLNSVMLEEAAQQSCSEPYERSDARTAHRNGFKPRTLKTSHGDLVLKKPQFREKSFESKIFENYSRVDQSLKNVILESYLQGVSTRKIEAVVKTLGVDELSASSVSRISKELDEKVNEFLKRPIEQEIRYLFVDATYAKIREQSRYVTKALFIVVGVRVDGYREILGAKLADSESESYWTLMFDELKERGLSGVQLVISDGHKGIQAAVASSFVGSSWQMCYVHYMRNILKHLPRKMQGDITASLRDAEGSELELQRIAQELRENGQNASANTLERFLPDVCNYKDFPKDHWKKIRTTNGVERINTEVKRRIRKIGAFPSSDSFMRLVGSILMNINEEWMTGNRYLKMESE